LYDARSEPYASKLARLVQEIFIRHFERLRTTLHSGRNHARITVVIFCHNR